ncbi:hypothetical protein [Streptomyces sp. NPDC048295]|uniref:hypothetical protein n=1 Tax=Streptomyces sp. NPDC048295 TaxID=3154617 RepID=UPI00341D3092
MIGEALTALAAAGGLAVAQAAGTSSWQSLQQVVARWFGRGQEAREQAALVRLEQSAATIAAADSGDEAQVRLSEQAVWQARFEMVLEGMEDEERKAAAEALRALLHEQDALRVVSAGDGGQAVGGNVSIRADHGVAALRMGDVTVGTPSSPDPDQG